MKNDIEVIRVFGLMTFGAAATNWDEEIFFFRTGIALRLHKDKNMET